MFRCDDYLCFENKIKNRNQLWQLWKLKLVSHAERQFLIRNFSRLKNRTFFRSCYIVNDDLIDCYCHTVIRKIANLLILIQLKKCRENFDQVSSFSTFDSSSLPIRSQQRRKRERIFLNRRQNFLYLLKRRDEFI